MKNWPLIMHSVFVSPTLLRSGLRGYFEAAVATEAARA